MKTTCAIAIINEFNEVLGVHPTYTGVQYSLPKGINEEDESYFETVYRELYEETNIDLNKIIYPFELPHDINGYFYYRHKNKRMKGFFIFLPKEKIDKIELKCYSYLNKYRDVLEVNGYRWLSIENDEYRLLHETQIEMIDIIKDVTKLKG